MSNRDLEIALRLRAEVEKAIKDLGRGEEAVKKQGDAAEKSSKKLGGMQRAMKVAGGAVAAYMTIGLARHLLMEADAFNTLQQRIKTATKATGDYRIVSAELMAISQQNGVALETTVGLFQNLARTAPELNATNSQMLQLTRTVQQLGVISGASTQAMNAGLLQFSQGLAGGVFRAEEFNSIVENLPEVALRIAKGMGKTVGELRAAVLEGEVLSKDVFESLSKQADEVNAEFGEMPDTLSRSTERLNNGFDAYLSRLDRALGGTSVLAKTINWMAERFETMASGDGIEGKLSRINQIQVALSTRSYNPEQAERDIARLRAEIDAMLAEGSSIEALRQRLQNNQAEFEAVDVREPGAMERIKELEEERVQLLDLLAEKELAFSDASEKTNKAEKDKAKAIQKTLDKLKESAETYGMTEAQVELYRLKARGATEDQLKLAASFLKMKEDAETADEALDALLDDAIAEEDANAKAFEKRAEKLERLKDSALAAADPTYTLRKRLEDLAEVMKAYPEHAEAIRAAMEKTRQEITKTEQDADKTAKAMAEYGEKAAADIEQNLGDTIASALKGDFEGIEEMWKNMLINMVAEALAADIMGAITGNSTGIGLSQIFGAFGMLHAGGVVGGGGQTKRVSPAVFLGAPRYHSGGIAGLAPDEVPAVLRRGEEVLTEDDPRHRRNSGMTPGSVVVEIINNGTPQQVQSATPRQDLERMVIQVVTSDIRRGGAISNSIGGTFGVQRGG